MRHSTTFLMLLIVASILVLMFLNLVLGSVSIPLKSVWNIVCGIGEEPVTWQNILDSRNRKYLKSVQSTK